MSNGKATNPIFTKTLSLGGRLSELWNVTVPALLVLTY